jgi:nucleotide-binding universal stress UspA family protein
MDRRDSDGPSAAILEFAEVNHVDHIIIGARGGSMLRSLLGSVSAKVAAEAGCGAAATAGVAASAGESR